MWKEFILIKKKIFEFHADCFPLGLTPFTTYEFRVLAVNKIGHGPPSDPVYITTGETGERFVDPVEDPRASLKITVFYEGGTFFFYMK